MTLVMPPRDCPLCPRLATYRADTARSFPDWHNAPVPSFGSLDARLLVVGLGPGLRGANRTGRPFTGDYAGDLLYATMIAHSFAHGCYRAPRDDARWQGDTLSLSDARVTNAVRCVPPANKPLPQEIKTCRRFLAAEIAAMTKLRVIVALGRVAHEATLAALALPQRQFPFAHAAAHELGRALTLFDSFHCSRYNTNTRRLTPEMFAGVFSAARDRLVG